MPYYAFKIMLIKKKKKEGKNRACHYILFSHYMLFI